MTNFFAILFFVVSISLNAQFDITKSYRGIVVEGMFSLYTLRINYTENINNGFLYTIKSGYAFGYNIVKVGYAGYSETEAGFILPTYVTDLRMFNIVYQRKINLTKRITSSFFAGLEFVKGYTEGQIIHKASGSNLFSPSAQPMYWSNVYEQKPYENISFPFGAEIETLFKHNIALFLNTQYDASIKYSIFSASLGIRYQFIIKR